MLMLLRHVGKTSPRIQVNRLSVRSVDEALPIASRIVAAAEPGGGRAELPLPGGAPDASLIEFDGDFDFAVSGDDALVGERVQFSLSAASASLSHLVERLVSRCGEFFPELAGTRLVDFRIRAINDRPQRVRVVLEFTDGVRTWKMAAVNSSVANATVSATLEALEYRLCVGEIGTFVPDAHDARQSALADNGR